MRRHPAGSTAMIAVALGLIVGLIVTSLLRDDPTGRVAEYGDRVPGQRIYDRTGLLSAGQLAAIDRRAAAIERSGIPVVVYIRDPAADAIDTDVAARQLMQLWDVESAPGAGDGLVLLLDVERDADKTNGVALIAGDRLGQDSLPPRETERIATDTMTRPVIRLGSAEGLVVGIGSGLAATERRLVLGAPAAPAPSLVERLVTGFVRVPLAVLSVLLALAALVSAGLLWWHRPRPSDPNHDPSDATTIPEPLRVALASNRVDGAVVAVAIRDLVRAGALAYDGPATDDWDGAPRGGLRLMDHGRVAEPIGQAMWADLAAVSGPGGRVAPADLATVSHAPRRLAATVAAELERHGWWDATAPRRAAPLRHLGRVLAGIGGAGLVLVLAVDEPSALWSVALLAVGAGVAWVCARTYPRATPLGLAIVRGR